MTIEATSRTGNVKIYRYGNWIVSNPDGFSPGVLENPTGSGAITITSGVGAPAYFLQNTNDAQSSEDGQTIEIVIDCKESTENKPFIFSASLGNFIEYLEIFPTKVVFATANNTEFSVEPGKHRYTLSISAEKTDFYIDRRVVYTNTSRTSSLGSVILAGYLITGATGTGVADVYYLKATVGAKQYLLLENMGFELEIDHTPTFTSTKKHTYTKDSFYAEGTLTVGALTGGLIGNLYNIQCSTDNTLVANLIPCIQLSSNNTGFYNLVNNTFYVTSAVTATGTSVTLNNLPVGYTEVEYLTFTGTQQVLTDIIINLSSFVTFRSNITSSDNQILFSTARADNRNVQSLCIDNMCVVYKNNYSEVQTKLNSLNKPHVFSTKSITLTIDNINYTLKYKDWEPISYTCGTWDSSVSKYDNLGLIAGCFIQIPGRTGTEDTAYYYRVRLVLLTATGTKYSVWAYNRKEESEQYITESPSSLFELPSINNKIYSFNFSDSNVKILLPNPTKAQWETYINNDGDNNLQVIEQVTISDTQTGNTPSVSKLVQTIEPKNAYKFTFNGTTWVVQHVVSQQYFTLYANYTNNVFKDTYYNRLPADSFIYSKDGESGVIAGLFRAYATEVDNQIFAHNTAVEYLDIYSMSPDDLYTKYASVFNIDKSLCKNKLEVKDLYQQLVQNQHLQLTKQGISNLVFTITGTRPKITELYDMHSWVVYTLRDSADTANPAIATDSNSNLLANNTSTINYRDMDFYNKDPYLPEEKDRYYIYDQNNPSRTYKPAVLWDSNDKAFSIVIEVYDPYNLHYGTQEGSTSKLDTKYKELIRAIIKIWKPAHLKTYIRFYNSEGVLDEERHWYYTYDSYNNALYSYKVEDNA